MSPYDVEWTAQASLVDDGLREALSFGDLPSSLLEALEHALLRGGQRLRPVLCLEAARICGGSREEALPAALAIEMVHAYSLVHDDLPCMDDADTRRGLPSVHKAFGEAVAVLAGDALLTLAFEVLAKKAAISGESWGRIALELAQAAGHSGIIAGQVEDLGEGPLTEEMLLRVHERKTAGLFRAAMRMGALAVGASSDSVDTLGEFGLKLGMAYQLIDDLEDMDKKETVNAVNLLGYAETQRRALRQMEEARACVQCLEVNAPLLNGLLNRLTGRVYERHSGI